MAARAVTVGVLAALWVCAGQRARAAAAAAGCDNGKLFVDRDLPAAAGPEDCGLLSRPESTQRLPSIENVYDPEPARKICMDEPISYSHAIPSSGAFRPVGAQSGEYVYCPPQRWLNNLYHGAAVLLYHPCAHVRERHLLSGLAHSCLQDYIVSSHPQLSRHRPIAAVLWGHTLEVASAASLDVCDWLETTDGRRRESDGETQTQKYDLLLTRPAALNQQQLNKTKGSVRQCCVQTISSLLGGGAEVDAEEVRSTQINARKMRSPRESNPDTPGKASSFLTNPTEKLLQGFPADSLLSPSSPTPGLDSEDFKQTKAPTPPPPPSTRSTPRANSLGLGAFRFQKSGLAAKTEADKRAGSETDLRPADVPAEKQHLADSEHSANTAIMQVMEAAKQEAQEKKLGGPMHVSKVFDVGNKQRLSPAHSHHTSDTSRVESASKSQSKSHKHQNLKQVDPSRPGNLDCGVCEQGKPCACTSGAGKRPAAVNKGLPRTPRTDEAVWAAGALGFLLILLTLSVLHTRLYRHWRTTPSLYWHDPRQDYDSVADVIRRRLRNVKARRKRGRRQECVLLPSSSSSDEDP